MTGFEIFTICFFIWLFSIGIVISYIWASYEDDKKFLLALFPVLNTFAAIIVLIKIASKAIHALIELIQE